MGAQDEAELSVAAALRSADAVRPVTAAAHMDRAEFSGNSDASAAAAATLPLGVEAGEEALLELERTHEESGAQRWKLLRQVIANLRTQVSEAVAALGEAQRRAAVLDEGLLRERHAREAADAAQQEELRALSEKLRAELRCSQEESLAALEVAKAHSEACTQASTAASAEALLAEAKMLRQALSSEEEARHRQGDEGRVVLEELRRCLRLEAEARAEAFKDAQEASSALATKLNSEKEERLVKEREVAKAQQALGEELRSLGERQSSDLDVLSRRVEELPAVAAAEAKNMGEQLQRLVSSVDEAAKSAETRLELRQRAAEERLQELGLVEPRLCELIREESAIREQVVSVSQKVVEEIAGSLHREAAERRGDFEQLSEMVKASMEASRREEQARELALAEQARALGSVSTKLEAEMCRHAETEANLQAELGGLRDDITNEHTAREAACATLGQKEAVAREELAGELHRCFSEQEDRSREWARLLGERLSTDLRSEREVAMAELRREVDEKSVAALAAVRTDLQSLLRQLENRQEEMDQAQTSALAADRAASENRAQQAAREVKEALDAHGEFAEALAKEQRLLVERLSEGMARAMATGEGAARRAAALEVDMQKVRSSLPLAFVAPSAFR